MRALLKKKFEKFICTKEQDLTFENLKQELTDKSMLAFYDPNKKCTLVTDACNESIGGILLQVNNNNKEKPVVYIRRSLTENGKKHSATELDALSLVWCIEKLHLYLYQIEFDVKVDHKPLQLIFGVKSKPSAGIER